MTASYAVGEHVSVRRAFPPGHVRTPFFIRGKIGWIDEDMGEYKNPEELAYHRNGEPKLRLYRVRFKQTDVWSDYDGPANDTIVVDIYENWLEPVS